MLWRGAFWCVGFNLATQIARATPSSLEPPPKQLPPPETEERAALLAAAFPDVFAERKASLGFAGISGLIGAAGLTATLASGKPNVGLISGSGLLMAGTVGYLVAPSTMDRDVLEIFDFAAFAAMELGIPRHTAGGARSSLPLSLGFLGSGALATVNLALSRMPEVARLRADYARIRYPNSRRSLGEDDVAAIEQDLLATEEPLAPWLVAMPGAAGALFAFLPAFDEKLAADRRTQAAALAGGAALFSLSFMIVAVPADGYRRSLSRAGLGLAPPPPGALGMGLHGTW